MKPKSLAQIEANYLSIGRVDSFVAVGYSSAGANIKQDTNFMGTPRMLY
jgi:hypothetical protein